MDSISAITSSFSESHSDGIREQSAQASLLIDHGGYGTTGDVAMLMNVVRKMREELPFARIAVRKNIVDPQIDIPGSDSVFEGLQDYFKNIICYFTGESRSKDASDNIDFDNGSLSSKDRRSMSVTKLLLSRLVGIARYILPASAKSVLRHLLILMGSLQVVLGSLAYRAFRVKWLLPRSTRGFVQSISQADALVIAGNGGFTDAFQINGALVYCLEICVARIFGKRVLLSGQGVGPIESLPTRWFVMFAFSLAHVATVREKASLRYVTSWLSKGASVDCVGDDAHDLTTSSKNGIHCAPIAPLRTVENAKRTVIAVNFRWAEYAMRASEGNDFPYLACKRLLSVSNAHLLFVPMLSRCEDELKRYGELVRRLGEEDRTEILEYHPYMPQQVKEAIGNADIAVGYSYHFIVFALSSQVPSVGLYETPYYFQKIHGAMEMYGVDDCCVDVCQNSWEASLEEKVQELMASRHEVANGLSQRYEKIAIATRRPLRQFARLLAEDAAKKMT